jgi:hypothetical protein
LIRLLGGLAILVELLPPAVAGRGDAARLQREVVRVGGLRERLFEGDEVLAPEAMSDWSNVCMP